MNYNRAIALLSQPRARLVVSYTHETAAGRSYHLEPGGRIGDRTAAAILRRPDVHPVNDGLFPGHPQSWKLERQR
jgi:hypothetical protein